jgi:hypothetical protein
VLVVALAAREAQADEGDAIAEGREQRVKTAAAMTGLALGVAVAGAATYGASQAFEVCGLSGCFPYPDPRLRLTAEALFAAGGGMALVALPTLLDAVSGERGPPRRAGRMGWGLALTSVGVGQLASMLVLGEALRRGSPELVLGQALPELEETEIVTALLVQVPAQRPRSAPGSRSGPRAPELRMCRCAPR